MRNRAAVKRRLEELAIHALSSVLIVDPDPDVDDDVGRTVSSDPDAEGDLNRIAVAYTWDGEFVTTSTFFLGVVEGASNPESLNKGPNQSGQMDDRFTIDGHIEVVGFDPTNAGARLAEEAAERVLNAFDQVLRSTRQLVHPDISSAMESSVYRISKATVGAVDGPFHGLPQPNAASLSGGITFTVDCLGAV